MVALETVGMLDVAKLNPILTSDEDVTNYSFITGDDGILYLVMQTITGDSAYMEDVVIPAGDYLNGYVVKAFEGKKLVVDGKHISGGVPAVDTILNAQDDGTLAEGTASGVYFVVTDVDITLTEAACKVLVMVA